MLPFDQAAKISLPGASKRLHLQNAAEESAGNLREKENLRDKGSANFGLHLRLGGATPCCR